MIVFDLQALQSEAHGGRGIGRFVRDLGSTLMVEHPSVVDAFVWNDRLPYVDDLDAFTPGDRLVAASSLADRAVDLLHVNSPFEMLPYDQVAVPVSARRTVVTCYDLIPYRFPDVYLTDQRAAARYRMRLGLIVSADHVVTDSHNAADDVVELLDVDRRRVTPIGGGAGPQFRPADGPISDVLSAVRRDIPDLADRFVLVPAGMDWRKNMEGAIDAFAALDAEVRAGVQMVVSCALTDGHRRYLVDRATRLGVGDRVLFTGHVTESTLIGLYQAADIVFFPSFYEGFGLPVVEARSCGARVICSGVSSLPEVLPDPAAHFDPWSCESMANALTRALADDEHRSRLAAVRDPRMTWSLAAARLVAVYEAVRAADRTVSA